MTRIACSCLAVSFTALQLGCTFYTGPPTGGPNAQPGNGTGGAGEIADFDGGPEPEGDWVNVTTNLATLASGCGNVSLLSAKPDDDMLIVGIATQGMWASTDGGQSWWALGLGALSAPITNLPTSIVYDPDNSQQFWESGVNGQVGVFRTRDNGKHFSARGMTQSNELVSVDLTDPDRKTLLAGGNAQKQTVHLSTDSGSTWQQLGVQFPANADVSSYPLVIDENTFLMGSVPKGGGVTGIFRSTDAGASWAQVSASGGQSAPLVTADGSIYWASPNQHGLVRSKDTGKSWTELIGANVLRSLSPIALPDGRLAAVSMQHIAVSSDNGENWKFASSRLPYQPNGVTYSKQRQAFFIWHSTCDNTGLVPGDAVMRYDYE